MIQVLSDARAVEYESDRGIGEQMPGQLLGMHRPARLAMMFGDDTGFSLR